MMNSGTLFLNMPIHVDLRQTGRFAADRNTLIDAIGRQNWGFWGGSTVAQKRRAVLSIRTSSSPLPVSCWSVVDPATAEKIVGIIPRGKQGLSPCIFFENTFDYQVTYKMTF
jgi:hypothetical protein